MTSKATFTIVCCLFGSATALSQAPAQERVPRDVTVTAIPGVVAAGARWQVVWQGFDNADGIVGTSDGGLLFAQEQPNTVRKLDKNDKNSV